MKTKSKLAPSRLDFIVQSTEQIQGPLDIRDDEIAVADLRRKDQLAVVDEPRADR